MFLYFNFSIMSVSRFCILRMLFICFALLPTLVGAQQMSGSCGFEAAHKALLEKDAFYFQAVQENERAYLTALANQFETLRSAGCAGDVRRVPVVVHVFHLGEPVGTGSNISDAQIIGAVNSLNGRWRGLIGDGEDMGFEFCMARRTPQGQPTNGIVRMDLSSLPGYAAGGIQHSGGGGAPEADVKGQSTWPQSDYYNIWVVHAIGSPGVAGYAYFPNGGPLDGTVLLAGSMTAGSTTLTHELGHGFSLHHTFEGDNDGADCPPDNDCTQDNDRVCDTPAHKRGDCGMTNPCGGGGDFLNSRFNFMSYCGGTTRFTAGQGVRVNAASYGNARLSLFSSEGCIPADQDRESGIVKILFPFEQPLCDPVFEPILELKNYGQQAINSISIEIWVDGLLYGTSTRTGSFSPGSLFQLTLDPVSLTLGGHDIEYLIVDINGAGTDTYVDNNILCTYLYYEPTLTSFPNCWDFEDGQLPPSWVVSGPVIPVSTHTGTGCQAQNGNTAIVFQSFNSGGGANGTQTRLALVPFDLTGMPGAALNFDVAMRKNYWLDHYGQLEVLVSDDCGANYTSVYRRWDTGGGQTEDLHTVPAPPNLPIASWVPTSCAHWRRDIADLSAFAGKEVLVAFRFTMAKNFSENLYLDNICVQSCDGFAEITALNGPAVCYPDSAYFSLNQEQDFVYKWFRNGSLIDSATTPEYKTGTPGKYFGIIEANGCRYSTDTLEMYFYPGANPQIIGNVSICIGDSATMDAGSGYAKYEWSNGDTTQIISAVDPGQYWVTVTNEFGCTGSDWTQVSTKATPSPNINGTLNFCEGGSTTLSIAAFFNNVLWNTGDTTNSIMVMSTGTYVVSVTGANGCIGRDTVIVTERIPDPPQISGVLAICSGEKTTLDAGQGYSNYKWTTGPLTQTIEVTTAGTYGVTVTDAFGCTSYAEVTVDEHTKPIPVVTGATTFCSGNVNLLDAGSGFSTYQWSTGASSQTIDVTASGTYSVTVSSLQGCTGTSQLNVTALPAPNPNISGNAAFCEGDSTILNAGNGFTTYTWSTGEQAQAIVVKTSGTYIVTVTNTLGCPGYDSIDVSVKAFPVPQITGILAICEGEQTTLDAGSGYFSYVWSNGGSNQQINVLSPGTYSVTVTTIEGCSGSASVMVSTSPNPQPTISGLTDICEGGSAILNAGPGYSNYLWSNGQNVQEIIVNSTGIYTVTVTNSLGCSGTSTHNLTAHPAPVVAITGNTTICEGTATTLMASPGMTSYLWSNGAATHSISVTQAGSYNVTVSNPFGCTSSATIAVSVLPLVDPSLQAVPTSACPGVTIQLIASGGTDYLWIESAHLLSDPTIPNPTIKPDNTVTVSVEVSNSCNAEVVSVTIPVVTPQGMAGPDLNVLSGKEVTLSAEGGIAYTWTGPSSLSCTNCPNPRITPGSSAYYFVEITDINGCKTLDSVFVEVVDDLDQVLELVNTITPNGDGFNDILIINGLESFDANSLTIYNRWGQQIFHEDNYRNSFNGYYKGNLLPAGTYYYVLRLWPGERIVKSSLVILHDEK